jgi:hypothetical protein
VGEAESSPFEVIVRGGGVVARAAPAIDPVVGAVAVGAGGAVGALVGVPAGASAPHVPEVVEGGEDLDRVTEIEILSHHLGILSTRKVDLCLSSICSVLVLELLSITF